MSKMNEFNENIIEYQLRFRGIKNEKIIFALKALTKDNFRQGSLTSFNYLLDTLSIQWEDSFIHWSSLMALIEKLKITKHHKILLLGSKLSHIAGFFSYLAKDVYVVDKNKNLESSHLLKKTDNMHYFIGEPEIGLPHQGPFDFIIFTCPAQCLPESIIWQQLDNNGKLVIPPYNFETINQFLLYTKNHQNIPSEYIIDADFIPMAPLTKDISNF